MSITETNTETSYLGSLMPGQSQDSMRSALRQIAKLYPSRDWDTLTYEEVSRIRADLLVRGLSPSTINHRLAAIRGVCKESWRLGRMQHEVYMRIADTPTVRGSRLPPGRSLQRAEVQSLFSCVTGSKALRDKALLALLCAGLRRDEVVTLPVSAYIEQSYGPVVRVVGKGNKEREVPLTPEWAMHISVYIEQVRGNELMFSLTPSGLWRVLKRLYVRAGIDAITPHDLRRTLAGDLLDAGADIVVVQGILGHSDPRTTAAYDRRPEQRKMQAIQLLATA